MVIIMVKVITYGTFDLLHHGHIRLLQRAKQLGDYLVVGVTADDFDRGRGKINVQQSLDERIAAVRRLNVADEIIVEEYEGQKIDDIRRYGIDIFTVGSDWKGVFDYLNDYCEVIYLPRTEGVSSTDIRSEKNKLKMGMVGYSKFLEKYYKESKYVNGIDIAGICVPSEGVLKLLKNKIPMYTQNYNELLEQVDAVYIHSHPQFHYIQCKEALLKGKHVLCESPDSLRVEEYDELITMAKKRDIVFMTALRTAYTTAYSRMLLLIKSGVIGNVVSVDATCTSLSQSKRVGDNKKWGALEEWGPTTLLPVFQILGVNYSNIDYFKLCDDSNMDIFTKISFKYQNSVASIKVGNGVKSEGELIVSGTKGYIYVPAPWWKTDYFEVRYENPVDNRRYFYQINGEGIRYELVAFVEAIRRGKPDFYVERTVSKEIIKILEIFNKNILGCE